MDRADLDNLSRNQLIVRAEAEGIPRARTLTRPELIDELLRRSETGRTAPPLSARGFFGRARNLLVKIVESGLHLPDASSRFRERKETRAYGAPPLPTVTLAEIYASQGHTKKAIEILEAVLQREPGHPLAAGLLARLSAPAPLCTEEDPPHTTEGCVAVPIEATSWRVAWVIDPRTEEGFAAKWPEGALCVCVMTIAPGHRDPQVERRFLPIADRTGEITCAAIRETDVVRFAVGWRFADTFIPMVHSASYERRSGCTAPRTISDLVRRTPDGSVSLLLSDDDAPWIAQVLTHAES